MKKLYKILYTFVLAAVVVACTEDPLSDIEGKSWQKERNIKALLIEGQIGTPVIKREGDLAEITIYAKTENIEDISKVKVKSIDLAYGATTQNKAGTTLDFSTGSTTITVVSGANKPLDWTVNLAPFKSDLEGTWYVGDVRIFADMFTWESWGWEKNESVFTYLPELAPEWDNVFTFTVEGADENGNPFGAFEFSAGADEVVGNFGDAEKGWDFNDRLRKIPVTTGTWLRDFERNKVIITDENNVEYELDLEVLTETNQVNLSASLEYKSELFDWDNTDWAYEELNHMSKKVWYTLTQNKVLQTGNSITSLSVKDQVGTTEIDEAAKEVSFVIADNGADLSAIELTDFSISYGATTEVSVGKMLDFSVDNKTTITITSESGEASTWTLILKVETEEPESVLAGTWSIDEIKLYADLFTWESWGWDKTEHLNNYMSSVTPELDNKIVFTYEGIDGEGNQYGTYENQTGTDGLNGEFIETSKAWDFNERFRTVPTGSGTWVLKEGVVIISANGKDYQLNVEAGATANEISLSSELAYQSDLFSWTDTDYSYEELAHMSNKMWYKLTK
ncbi:hypothetical protein [Ochrovirga pacifica]|uniref:hypothetical protein n=1 Tax=Ochrovirga pacifica TaxID=1042376 RepID=UPI00025583EA|nr:hypothetical protein [Ochrovirga pacifica]